MSSSPTTPTAEGNGGILGNGNAHPDRRQTEWAGAVHAGAFCFLLVYRADTILQVLPLQAGPRSLMTREI